MMMDSSGLDIDGGNNTLFLLHRLQELKEWQKEQEIKLSEEKKGVHFQEYEEEVNDHDDDVLQLSISSTEEEDDTTIEQELPYVREAIDEKPIRVHKTFEQLLEEELLKDTKSQTNHSPTKNVHHSFLRKGSGLQRFTPKRPTIQSEECNLSINDSVEVIRPPHEIVRKLSCDIDEDFSEVCDSVELSFMQKIKTLQKKEQEELAAFEILEEAAVDTSFSSNSSVVRRLIQSAGSKASITSTPKRKGGETGSLSRNTYTLPSNNAQPSARSSLNDEESDDTITNKIDEGDSNNISNDFSPFHDQSGHSFICETPNIYSFIENNEVSKKNKTRSPLSSVKMLPGNNAGENQKFNSKISDLEKEILKYKDENNKLQKMKSTLLSDKRKLASDIQKFEKTKEDEKKKLEEERRRIKRDEKLLEKAKKDLNAVQNNVHSKEVQFIQNKMKLLKEDFNKKESRWNASFKKLQDRIKVLERENQNLHEENHRLKLRRTSSKVFKEFKKTNSKTDTEELELDDEKTPPSKKDPETKVINSSTTQSPNNLTPLHEDINSNKRNVIPYFKLNAPQAKQETDSEAIPFTYSGVDSLESDITLVDNSDVSKVSENVTLLDVRHNPSKGTTEKTYSDGTVEVSYSNGNRKECQDGVTKVFYYNGDVKISETTEQIVKYYYSKTKTWHLTYPDKEVFKFDNGQQEIRYKDGTYEIIFTDGSVKKVLPDRSEIIVFPDKTRVNVTVDGHKIISFPNGQVETHMPEYKKRQYLDGTVKILHNDGKQETRYANGRVRIKNKSGELIYDSTEAGPL